MRHVYNLAAPETLSADVVGIRRRRSGTHSMGRRSFAAVAGA